VLFIDIKLNFCILYRRLQNYTYHAIKLDSKVFYVWARH